MAAINKKKTRIFMTILFFLMTPLLMASFGCVSNAKSSPLFASASEGSENSGSFSEEEDFAKGDIPEEVDMDALTREIRHLEEDYSYPDFFDIFRLIRSLRFKEAAKEIGDWLVGALTHEIASSRILVSELVGVVIFSGIFSNLSVSFSQYAIGNSGFMISYFIVFSIIFSNFTLMTDLFKNTVVLLSNLLKIVIPVYTLTVSLSGNLSVGVAFYEYFMLLVLIVNWVLITIILPLVQYYLLLELLAGFSTRQNISRLCESMYLLLFRGMKFLFFIFFGLHLLETMIVPSMDLAKNSILGRITSIIPGGSMVQTVTGTVIGSSILIKNAMGVSAILFILLLLAIPMIKLLIYAGFYLLLSILLEPVSDPRFIRCITAAQKSGMLFVYYLSMTSALFVLIIAVTAMATNHI